MSGSSLTLEERYLIHAGCVYGLSVGEIAKQLRRDRSVINDERRRGMTPNGEYCLHQAQLRREEASARSSANSKGRPASTWREVKKQLEAGWSPEQISGRWKLLGAKAQISTPAIYAGVRRFGWQSSLYWQKIRAHLKRPARHPWGESARSIHERAEEANLRIEAGHWEGDSMIGRKKDVKRVVHLVERQSLYWELLLIKGGKSEPTVKAIKKRLEGNGLAFHTISTDRGSEFHATGDILDEKALACDAYTPNQRASNENQIGALRADLPKGVSMDNLTPKKLRRLQQKHNHRPRKCLGFLTPYEVAFNRQPRVGTRT